MMRSTTCLPRLTHVVVVQDRQRSPGDGLLRRAPPQRGRAGPRATEERVEALSGQPSGLDHQPAGGLSRGHVRAPRVRRCRGGAHGETGAEPGRAKGGGGGAHGRTRRQRIRFWSQE